MFLHKRKVFYEFYDIYPIKKQVNMGYACF